MTKKRLYLLPVLLLFAMSIILPVIASPLEAVDDEYTKSLLHFDGADTSTTFTDESGKTWTASGNAQLDTAQSKFGSASLLLDGNGDWITSADSDDFTLGSNNFTIDLWVRFNQLHTSGYKGFYEQFADTNNRISWRLYTTTGAAYSLNLNVMQGGASTIDIWRETNALATNTWYHFALVRSGNNFYIFQDGSLLYTTAVDTDAITDNSGTIYIGTLSNVSSNAINGWIDEFRFTNGIARWTSNFTPPSSQYEPTPTVTPSSTYTATITDTPTQTYTPTITDTPTQTYTPTITDTPTITPTSTNTPLGPTATHTATSTATDTPTITPTVPTATPVTPAWTLVPEITYGDYAVTLSFAGLCLVVILIALTALGLYVGQRKGKR